MFIGGSLQGRQYFFAVLLQNNYMFCINYFAFFRTFAAKL